MKKTILFFLLMLTTLFTYAQKGSGALETKIQQKVDHMAKQLNLSADQQEKVKALYTAKFENRKHNKKDKKGMTAEEVSTLKAERKTARAEFDKEMAAILTPEQMEQYKATAKKKGQKKKAAHKGKNKKSSAEKIKHKVSKLAKELDLTEEQQKQLIELMSNRKKGSKVDKAKRKELSKEEKEAIKADRKAEKEAYKAAFENILSPEQLATYEKMKAERKEKQKAKKEAKKQRETKKISEDQ